jgi:hypothetical protein
MKFNPLTKEIFTDNDEFIKKLFCPLKLSWSSLQAKSETTRTCVHCHHTVLDTKFVTDEALLNVVRENPNTCLKVNLEQHNIKII